MAFETAYNMLQKACPTVSTTSNTSEYHAPTAKDITAVKEHVISYGQTEAFADLIMASALTRHRHEEYNVAFKSALEAQSDEWKGYPGYPNRLQTIAWENGIILGSEALLSLQQASKKGSQRMEIARQTHLTLSHTFASSLLLKLSAQTCQNTMRKLVVELEEEYKMSKEDLLGGRLLSG
jgi:hypothetical protein